MELSGDLPDEPLVKLKVLEESKSVENKYYEWRIVDTVNRTMDIGARLEERGYTHIGKTSSCAYPFFDGMIIDIHFKKPITQVNSAYVILSVGDTEIRSPPFLSEKTKESRRKRAFTNLKKRPVQKQAPNKKQRVAESDDETSSEDEEDGEDSDSDSDVETDCKAIQCEMEISTEDLRRMLRARGENIGGARGLFSGNFASSAASSAAASLVSDKAPPIPDGVGSHSSSSIRSRLGKRTPISPDRLSLMSSSSPCRSRAGSFDLLGPSFDNMGDVPMPPLMSSGSNAKIMEMLTLNQKQLIGVVANLVGSNSN